jgi:casein kinase II subunit beta
MILRFADYLLLLLKDVVEGEEEEEEEDDDDDDETGAGVPMSGQQPSVLSSLTSNYSARTSPTSISEPKLDSNLMIDLSVYALPRFSHAAEGGKVKTVRQWAPRMEFGGTAQV